MRHRQCRLIRRVCVSRAFYHIYNTQRSARRRHYKSSGRTKLNFCAPTCTHTPGPIIKREPLAVLLSFAVPYMQMISFWEEAAPSECTHIYIHRGDNDSDPFRSPPPRWIGNCYSAPISDRYLIVNNGYNEAAMAVVFCIAEYI